MSRSATRSYDIVIGRGQLASLGARIAKLRPGAKVAIVTDENVAAHHLDAAQRGARRRRHADRHASCVPPGESIEDLRACFERVCDGADRARGSSAAISWSRSAAA